MLKDDLTLCVYSTTRGHWGRKNCYFRTIQDLDIYNLEFFDKIAHIKVSPGDEDLAEEMEENFFEFGYKVLKSAGAWKHWDGSHSVEQLKDIFKVVQNVKSNFVAHLEDDWALRPLNNNLNFYLEKSIELLRTNPEALQVRIPRHADDPNHYKTMVKYDEDWNRQDEIFSLNPHVISRADLEIICSTVFHNQESIIPLLNAQNLNVELLFASIGRQLKNQYCFWSHAPENIRALHIGNEFEDDKL